jgi:hypothetical protein
LRPTDQKRDIQSFRFELGTERLNIALYSLSVVQRDSRLKGRKSKVRTDKK